MNELIRFLVTQLSKKSFWMLVTTSVIGMLMFEIRSGYKDQIFQDAIAQQKSRGWPGFKR